MISHVNKKNKKSHSCIMPPHADLASVAGIKPTRSSAYDPLAYTHRCATGCDRRNRKSYVSKMHPTHYAGLTNLRSSSGESGYDRKWVLSKWTLASESGYSKAEVGTRERKWISCLNVGTLAVERKWVPEVKKMTLANNMMFLLFEF